jgi:trk system potassium uptake protein TrkA
MSLSTLQRLLPQLSRKRQFAVIGLGRFGRAVCLTLHQLGLEVLGIDSQERLVNDALSSQILSHALELDTTDSAALREAGIFEFDVVVVAIGNYVEQSIITTLNLKEGNVPTVIAKASSEVHGKLLQRVGADRVIFPEHEMGCQLARSLVRPGILDRIDLDAQHCIVELEVPSPFVGKTLQDLELRNRYGITVLATRHGETVAVNPPPNLRLDKNSLLVVLGNEKAIEDLPN